MAPKPTPTGVHPARALAHWSAIQFVLFSITLVVLGLAIGWPGILREPASKVLPTIHAAALPTAVGYFSYLLASVALIAMALSLRRTLLASAGGLTLDCLTLVGAAAGVLKTLGIARWLTVMPVCGGRGVEDSGHRTLANGDAGAGRCLHLTRHPSRAAAAD
jgi:hypothetical protein